jgi:predicted secreted hydrolase
VISRRSFAVTLAAGSLRPPGALAGTARAPDALVFPRDFGAHPDSRIEWWYVTGALEAGARLWGFQITFFRAGTGLAAAATSRFAARQIVFAHAAVTDLEKARLRHDQRIARSGFGIAEASSVDTSLLLRDWRLVREPRADASRYRASAASESAGFRFELVLDATGPVLLQGDGGLSQKGPQAAQASCYYSEPQLAVHGRLALDGGKPVEVGGRAWLDHEWSDSFLDASAVGWDWIGMNLDDGSALTAFRLRRADGTSVYAGGSFRRSGEAAVRSFAPGEVTFTPGRVWQSAVSKARYPVQWRVTTPTGTFSVAALLDDQELDSRGSTGSIYWEGLSELLDDSGKRIGRGYLEMTGYAATLRM